MKWDYAMTKYIDADKERFNLNVIKDSWDNSVNYNEHVIAFETVFWNDAKDNSLVIEYDQDIDVFKASLSFEFYKLCHYFPLYFEEFARNSSLRGVVLSNWGAAWKPAYADIAWKAKLTKENMTKFIQFILGLQGYLEGHNNEYDDDRNLGNVAYD